MRERVSRVWARPSRLLEKEIGSAYARDQTPQAVLCLARFEYILLICFHFIPSPVQAQSWATLVFVRPYCMRHI